MGPDLPTERDLPRGKVLDSKKCVAPAMLDSHHSSSFSASEVTTIWRYTNLYIITDADDAPQLYIGKPVTIFTQQVLPFFL